MNKEKTNTTKPVIQFRGRWSIRLNNELLDLAQREVDSWEFISKKLGFSIEVRFNICLQIQECKQQYDYLLHPEKYEQQFISIPNTKKPAKETKSSTISYSHSFLEDETKEKKRHRIIHE